MTDIKITDNFLNKEQFEFLQNEMQSPYFAWFFNDNITYENEENLINHFQFTHSFFKDNLHSNRFDLLNPLLEKFNHIALVRIKANLGTRTEKNIEHGFHIDCHNKAVTTAIYYINNNNGYTLFKDGQKVESKANRLVQFNSTKQHSSVSQTDTKARIVINFNYLEEVKVDA